MKKVMYAMTSLSHKRVFETFEPRDDMEQLIIGPTPKITNKSKIVPEDYSDFKIKNIKLYPDILVMQKIIDKFCPNIYVSASLPIAKGLKLPKKCKKVYVSHGMIGNHVAGVVKKSGINTSVWRGGDLYCGATQVFADWVKKAAGVGDDNILTNAFPQLDIIHDSDYYNSYRERVLNKTKHPKAKKVILFIGFCCKNRYDFINHNEDYFRTVIELERIAKEHDWLILVKPRHTLKSMIKFLATQKWGKKYANKYAQIQDSKHLHFISTTGHIYRYFFADVFVLNGTSTVEVEACAIGKPLFIVRTCLKDRIDPYSLLSTHTAMSIPDLNELEHDLTWYFDKGEFHWPDRQRKRIADMGIEFDGKMHNRIQDKLGKL